MKYILFVCTGNTCRSPFAAEYFQSLLEKNGLSEKYLSESAGTYAANDAKASKNMVTAARDYGVDLTSHVSRLLTSREAERAELVLCMETSQKGPIANMGKGIKVFTLNEYAGYAGDIADPYGGGLDEYRSSAKSIAAACDKLIEKLKSSTPHEYTVSLGNDHAGVNMKKAVIAYLREKDIRYVDFGCADEKSVDYVDYAEKVCASVLDGRANAGILICGTGIGMSIAANKINGIRASLCGDVFSAKAARAHNDSNVLCLGARVLGEGAALEIVETWLSAEFMGAQHSKRLDKIKELEKRGGGI